MNQNIEESLQHLFDTWADQTFRPERRTDASNNVWENIIQSTLQTATNHLRDYSSRQPEEASIPTPTPTPTHTHTPTPTTTNDSFSSTFERRPRGNPMRAQRRQPNIYTQSTSNTYSVLQNRQLNILTTLVHEYNRNMRDYQRNISECLRILRNIRYSYMDNDTFGRHTPPFIPTPSMPSMNMNPSLGENDTQLFLSYTLYPSTSIFREVGSPAVAGQFMENNHILTQDEILRSTRTYSYDRNVETTDLSNNVCPISLETFYTGDVLCEILGCGHKFKYHALMYWLRNHSSCPVCRYNIHDYREPSSSSPRYPQNARQPSNENVPVVSSSTEPVLYSALSQIVQEAILPSTMSHSTLEIYRDSDDE